MPRYIDKSYFNQIMKQALRAKNDYEQAIWDILDDIEETDPQSYDDLGYILKVDDAKDALSRQEMYPCDVVDILKKWG